MAVLVTGAAGFFGSALVRSLAARGADVIALDRTPPDDRQPRSDAPARGVTHVCADLTDRATLDPRRLRGVTGIVHAAAVSPPDGSAMAQQLLDANVGGTIEALRLAHQVPSCRTFLYVSSVAVYDLTTSGTVCEPDATGGTSLYGATKLAAENVALRFGEAFGLDVGVVRPSSLWGPGEVMRPTRPFVTPVQALVEHATRREGVQLHGLDARRDWLYVDDAAEATTRFFASPMGGRTVNLAMGAPIRFGAVVEAVADIFDLQVDPRGSIVDGGEDRPARICTQAIRAVTGWQPRSDLRSTLTDYRRYLETPAATPRPVARC